MNPSAQLLVFVTMFAADQAGGIQALHLDPAKGTLAPEGEPATVKMPSCIAIVP